MKFWQIAAAVLMFKLFDWILTAVDILAHQQSGNPPAVLIFIVAIFVWLLLALVVWLAMRDVGRHLSQ